MEFEIRKGKISDIESILTIIEEARELFKSINSPQWLNGYPNYESFKNDINNGQLYVMTINDIVVATMSVVDYDPCYDYIEGKWLSNDNYVAIHRIAVKKEYRHMGIASKMIKFVETNFKQNIRIDTHRLNVNMREFLKKNGFVECGIIYLNQISDRERIAFEKVKE